MSPWRADARPHDDVVRPAAIRRRPIVEVQSVRWSDDHRDVPLRFQERSKRLGDASTSGVRVADEDDVCVDVAGVVGEPSRDPKCPQFCDACFTGDYPTRLTDMAERQSPELLTLPFGDGPASKVA